MYICIPDKNYLALFADTPFLLVGNLLQVSFEHLANQFEQYLIFCYSLLAFPPHRWCEHCHTPKTL